MTVKKNSILTLAFLFSLAIVTDAKTCNITVTNGLSLKDYIEPAKVLQHVPGNKTSDECFQECCDYADKKKDICTTALYYQLSSNTSACYLVSCIPEEDCIFDYGPGYSVILAQMNKKITYSTTAPPKNHTFPVITMAPTAAVENATTPGNGTNTTAVPTLFPGGSLDQYIDEAGFVDTFIIIFVVSLAVLIGVGLLGLVAYMGCREQIFGPEHKRLKEEFPRATYHGADK